MNSDIVDFKLFLTRTCINCHFSKSLFIIRLLFCYQNLGVHRLDIPHTVKYIIRPPSFLLFMSVSYKLSYICFRMNNWNKQTVILVTDEFRYS